MEYHGTAIDETRPCLHHDQQADGCPVYRRHQQFAGSNFGASIRNGLRVLQEMAFDTARSCRAVRPDRRSHCPGKALKKWQRVWKLRLISEANPEWTDLFGLINR